MPVMNILLVRLRLIGDVIFTTPAIRAVRRHYPNAQLDYLVEEEAVQAVDGNPHLDRVIVAASPRARGRLRKDIALARTLRARRYDLAIDFHGGPRSSLLTWLSGAPQRIGYKVKARGWMYTTTVPRPLFSRRCHSVQNQWELLMPLRIAAPDPAIDSTEMTADPAAIAEIDRRLANAGVRLGDPVVVIHVSAGNPFRRWPAASFVDLVCRLIAADRGRRIILTSGPSDREAARQIADAARARLPEAGWGAVIHGEFNVAGLRALIDRAALYIGGDSGPLHIASTTQTPIVGLYGPTLSLRSEPWRDPSLATENVEVGPLPCRPCDQRRCEPGDFRCLSGITAEAVAAGAERAWTRAHASDSIPVVVDVERKDRR